MTNIIYIFMGMNTWRVLLFPFALLYGGITTLRNVFFDGGLLPIHKIQTPSIGVGNLSVGGTGKSVVVDYLISNFKNQFRIAVLSRGYGRVVKGVFVADENSTAASIGDEPYQFFSKHREIKVVVAEKRLLGLRKIEQAQPEVDLLILDDVMQHRFVQPTALVLTTTYTEPYSSDFVLPMGNLRESRAGAQRADVILVTKCPDDLTEQQMKDFREGLNVRPNQNVFFSKINYATSIQNKGTQIKLNTLKTPFTLITGIADPAPLEAYLRSLQLDFVHLSFPDHHRFTPSDIKQIKSTQNSGVILTTEKDFTRLYLLLQDENLFYLPIEMGFFTPAREREFKDFLKKQLALD